MEEVDVLGSTMGPHHGPHLSQRVVDQDHEQAPEHDLDHVPERHADR